LKATQEENVRAAADVLELTQRRQQYGLTTDLDVNQARTQLDETQRQLPIYDKQVQQAMNALSVLTGQNPGALDAMLSAVKPLPPINLGVRALDASYLTRWASLFYSVGPSISVPIFEGGRLTANLKLARAETEEAALHYRGAVLNALREVEDGLVAYRTDRAARDRLADTVSSAEQTLYLARDQYSHGLTAFIQVLDAERTLVSQRQQLVQADAQIVNDVVALYRALGGGWQESAGDVPAPAVPALPPMAPGMLDSVAASAEPIKENSGGQPH
jgi:outer membrane protein TolC